MLLIKASRNNMMEDFRGRFARVDVLLIDDIMFIRDEPWYQTEFVHVFDTLYKNGKRIIVTAEPPGDLTGFDEILKARFELGTIVEILPPDTETKISILRMHAEIDGIDLPEDVASFIANSVTSSIRAMIGFLSGLGAGAKIRNAPVTLKLAREYKRRQDEIDARWRLQRPFHGLRQE